MTPQLPQGSPPQAIDATVGAAGEVGRDELDPELLALPDPPRRARTLTVVVLALASVAALAMVVALRHDVAYAFRDSTPLDVGDLHAVSDATLSSIENRYVRAEGLIGARGIRYERPSSTTRFGRSS